MTTTHAHWCPRRTSTTATCACGFTRPVVDRPYLPTSRALALWGAEKIELYLERGLLEPTAAGYLVLSSVLADEARQRNGSET